jgi:hypothetical protein
MSDLGPQNGGWAAGETGPAPKKWCAAAGAGGFRPFTRPVGSSPGRPLRQSPRPMQKAKAVLPSIPIPHRPASPGPPESRTPPFPRTARGRAPRPPRAPAMADDAEMDAGPGDAGPTGVEAAHGDSRWRVRAAAPRAPRARRAAGARARGTRRVRPRPAGARGGRRCWALLPCPPPTERGPALGVAGGGGGRGSAARSGGRGRVRMLRRNARFRARLLPAAADRTRSSASCPASSCSSERGGGGGGTRRRPTARLHGGQGRARVRAGAAARLAGHRPHRLRPRQPARPHALSNHSGSPRRARATQNRPAAPTRRALWWTRCEARRRRGGLRRGACRFALGSHAWMARLGPLRCAWGASRLNLPPPIPQSRGIILTNRHVVTPGALCGGAGGRRRCAS